MYVRRVETFFPGHKRWVVLGEDDLHLADLDEKPRNVYIS